MNQALDPVSFVSATSTLTAKLNNVKSGEPVLIVCQGEQAIAVTCAGSDTLATTYSVLASGNSGAGHGIVYILCGVPSTSGTNVTFTGTWSGGTVSNAYIQALAYHGVNGCTLDGSPVVSTTNSGSGVSTWSTTITTNFANDIIFSTLHSDTPPNGGQFFTSSPAGFLVRGRSVSSGGFASMDGLAATAGSYSPSLSNTTASGVGVLITVALRSDGTSSSTPCLSPIIVAEGDSLTNSEITSYPEVGAQLLSQESVVRNQSTGGITITTMNSRAATVVDPFFDANRTANIASGQGGINDYAIDNTVTATTLWSRSQTWINGRISAGFKVLWSTITSTNDNPMPNTLRAAYNALVTAAATTICGPVSCVSNPSGTMNFTAVDVGSDSQIGCNTCCTNAALFLNCPHLNASGHSIWAGAPYYSSALQQNLQASISITTPTASQTISGSSFTFTCSVTSAPSIASVSWSIDGEPTGISRTAPYSLTTTTFDVWNGSHKVVATALDALNNVLATSGAITYTVNNIWPYDTQSTGLSTAFQTTFSVTPSVSETSNWAGTVTLSGTLGGTYNTGTATTLWSVYVDGRLVIADNQNGNTTTRIESLNTTRFLNGPHQVVFTVGADSFNFYGQWERTVTFANGTSNMELVGSASELFLCVTPGVNCPSSTTLSALMLRSDGTTAAASSPSFTAAAPSNEHDQVVHCSVGASSGIVTAVSTGVCQLTMTASGFTRTIWAYIFTSANVTPHFGNDGTILTTYNASKSLFMNSMFFSDQGTAQYAANRCYLCDYTGAGWNAIETAVWSPPVKSGSSYNQTTYQNGQAAFVNNWMSKISAYPNLYIHGIGDDMMRGNYEVYRSTRDAPSAWSPAAVTYAFQQWAGASRPMIGVDMVDEVQSGWDHKPLGSIPQMGGSNGPSSIICVAGANCTVNWTDPSLNGGAGFIIRGSVQGLNSAYPSAYIRSGLNANGFTFPNPGVGNITLTSGNDPGLVIEPFANTWMTANDYIRWDAFQQFMTFANAVPGRPKMTWPNSASTSGTSFYNWEGDPNMSDYATCFFQEDVNSHYLSTNYSSWSLLGYQLDVSRNMCRSNINLNTQPFVLQSIGTMTNYGFQGYSVPIATITDDTITFAAPHNIPVVYPGITRLRITGSTNGYDNNYYVRDCRTATSCRVYLGTPSSGGDGAGGTITWDDSTTTPLNTAAGSTHIDTVAPKASYVTLRDQDIPCVIATKRGHTFTVSGSSLPVLNSGTWFQPFDNASVCPGLSGPTPGFWIWRIPSGSSTGGTASIIADGYLEKGRQQSRQTSGARYDFASSVAAVVTGAVAQRKYGLGDDAQQFDPASGNYAALAVERNRIFTDTHSDTYQLRQYAQSPNGGQDQSWWSSTHVNLFAMRFAKYLLQPRTTSPDFGLMFETTARTGSYGNLLMIASFSDGSLTRTIDFTSYVVGGQKILKVYASWRGMTVTSLNVGTTSDTVAFDPCAFVAYIFPNNFAAEYGQPTLSVRLADIPNATKVAVRYAYAEALVDQNAAVFDCGNGSNCPLPVDRAIGPIYHRDYYLDVNGKVLATSGVTSF